MTRAELISAIHAELPGHHRHVANEVVEAVLEEIKLTLEAGEVVKISGFGKFSVRDKRARRGRNPQTGRVITLDARRVVTFRPSPVLKAAVNADHA